MSDITYSEDGQTVTTTFAEGPNLLMLTGQPGWSINPEQTRTWDSYTRSQDTEPTLTLHYEANGATAAEGFAALFVPFEGDGPPHETSFDRISSAPDGSRRLHVTVDGKRRTLKTMAFGQH